MLRSPCSTEGLGKGVITEHSCGWVVLLGPILLLVTVGGRHWDRTSVCAQKIECSVCSEADIILRRLSQAFP